MELKENFYFETKVKSMVPDESTGKMKNKTFVFSFLTVNFTSAETLALIQMDELGWNDYDVFSISRTKISEHHLKIEKDDDKEYKFFKIKIEFEDEDSKPHTIEMLIEEENFTSAKEAAEIILANVLANWKIKKCEETEIISVIKDEYK
jgi:hypothetical protein